MTTDNKNMAFVKPEFRETRITEVVGKPELGAIRFGDLATVQPRDGVALTTDKQIIANLTSYVESVEEQRDKAMEELSTVLEETRRIKSTYRTVERKRQALAGENEKLRMKLNLAEKENEALREEILRMRARKMDKVR